LHIYAIIAFKLVAAAFEGSNTDAPAGYHIPAEISWAPADSMKRFQHDVQLTREALRAMLSLWCCMSVIASEFTSGHVASRAHQSQMPIVHNNSAYFEGRRRTLSRSCGLTRATDGSRDPNNFFSGYVPQNGLAVTKVPILRPATTPAKPLRRARLQALCGACLCSC
jgi:hypothetical protein